MHYINTPNTKAILYRDLVDMAIKNGVEPKRVYIYLASMGIRGELTRIMTSDFNGYGKPVKIAMMGDNTFITRVDICDHCGSLSIS